jgi:hypothetical protein
VLVPGGVNVLTVRTKQDAHYGTGIRRGEDMYEVGGFIVHFFHWAKVETVSTAFEILVVAAFCVLRPGEVLRQAVSAMTSFRSGTLRQPSSGSYSVSRCRSGT